MSVLNHLFNRKEQVKEDKPEDNGNAFLDDGKEKRSGEHVLSEKDAEIPAEAQEEEPETYEILEREIHPAKIICPDCGGITLEGFEFCDKCGGELL